MLLLVSPGLRSRPSLSAASPCATAPRRSRVAGITVPAFVERASACPAFSDWHSSVAGITVPAFVERSLAVMVGLLIAAVSPGLRSRPSLSDEKRNRWVGLHRQVSPGLRSRPSLSGPRAPAPRALSRRVARITVPAFVERWAATLTGEPPWSVSPGLRSRPSLSGYLQARLCRCVRRCRRDYGPGLR